MQGNNAPTGWMIVTTGLSLSIGWGIRGNFGHEYGAMIPGALAAMAAALLSGREDWWKRAAHFGFFGGLGWSLGGSMSYMQVIAYTHSGHSGSVLYGFAALFLIGFLWAAMGGAGTALPAVLDRKQLDEFFVPLTAVFLAWCLQDLAVAWLENTDPQFRQASPLYWYDTDWLAAAVAIGAVVILALARRRVDAGSSLILHMAIGWWIGFLGLVVILGWRMTPPRGDNWAGCLGMVGGMWLFFARRGWTSVTLSSLITGFVGGFGFATATLFELLGVKTGWQTNWHSVLEQNYGSINGIGLGIALAFLARTCRPLSDDPAQAKSGTTLYSAAFVLLAITYLNLRKNPGTWVKAQALPPSLAGLSPATWFDLGYLLLGGAVLALLAIHRHHRIPLVPESALGRGQLLYLVFLWWMVMGNLERALVHFTPQRLVTEGVIHVNAVLCTLLVLLGTPARAVPSERSLDGLGRLVKRTVAWGCLGLVVSVTTDWAIVRSVYRDQPSGFAGRHIRFGPNATATKEKPRTDQPHP